MTSKQRIKGNGFERQVVNRATKAGLRAERSRGSDGRSLGHGHEVDAVFYDVPGFGDLRIQTKIRKAIADYLKVPGGCDAVVVREDRGRAYIIMDLEWFLEKTTCIKN